MVCNMQKKKNEQKYLQLINGWHSFNAGLNKNRSVQALWNEPATETRLE